MGYLREAKKEDMQLLFEWRNEIDVRKNSFSSNHITFEKHKEWFEKIIQKKNEKQYIFICNGEAIGQIRATIYGDEAEVHYSICSEKRCMGYGKEMLNLLKKQIIQDFPQVKKLSAKVKRDNIASRKMLLKLKFEEIYDYYELVIEKK